MFPDPVAPGVLSTMMPKHSSFVVLIVIWPSVVAWLSSV